MQNIDTSLIKQKTSLIISKILTPLLLSGSVVISADASVQALQFNFTYAPGTNLDQMLGYEMAGKYWSNYLSDDVTVNIFIEPTNLLPNNVIGGAIPGVTSQNLTNVYRRLQSDVTSLADIAGVANITSQCYLTLSYVYQTLYSGNWQTNCNGYNANLRYYDFNLNPQNFSRSLLDINNINLTRANAKALSLINPNDSGYDGYILVSNLGNITKPLAWNYFSETNSSNTIPTGTLDYFSVAIHELTHTLGFISGVDSPEYTDKLAKRSIISGSDIAKYGYLMDMFRVSNNGMFNDNGRPDISPGANTMLSIDGGITRLGNMSSGTTKLGGDGNQGSHWKKDNTYDGIMESSIGAGDTRRQVSSNDLTVLDVLGWNLRQNNQDLLTIFNSAKSGLANKMGVTSSWMDANPTQAALRLTPGYIDANNNGYDDRGEALNRMVTSSGTYNWGWNGYWWGWNGYWWGWNGYWQNAANLTADGFWQNFAWETLDEFVDDESQNISSNSSQSVPEPTTIVGLLTIALSGIVTKLKQITTKF